MPNMTVTVGIEKRLSFQLSLIRVTAKSLKPAVDLFRATSTTPRMSSARRTAVVTGATKGIGRGLVLGLAEGGWHVIATGRTVTGEGSLEDLAKDVKGKGGTCQTYTVDHSDDDQVKEFFGSLDASLKSNDRTLDVFVNNAYSGVGFLARTSSVPDWKKQVSDDNSHPGAVWDLLNNVGLRNNYVCSMYATRIMHGQSSGGVIVNITSYGGFMSTFDAVYSVGKEAVNRLTAEFSLRTPPHIKVLALCPGMAGTESLDAVMDLVTKQYDGKLTKNVEAVIKENVETPLFIGRVLAAVVSDSCFVDKVDGKVVVCAEAGNYFNITDENNYRPLSFRSLKMMLWSSLPQYRESFLLRNIPRGLVIPWTVLRMIGPVKFW